jgi:hypothetical protein
VQIVNIGHKGEGMPRPTSQSWQSILERSIQLPGERQRLVTALGINPMTLNRWLKAETQPNRNHLIELLRYVQPQYRQELRDAMRASYPEIDSWVVDENPEQISAEFYIQILNDRATLIETTRNREILDKIIKQALIQLDPHQLGMAITLVQCMPPTKDGKIHSLRERMGRGTPPWIADLENLSIFLAMESLAGFVVQYQRPASIEDISKETLLPAYQTDYEVSAAAAPIMLDGNIAGCLLASSTEVDHFTQQRLTLLTAFSDMTSLALESKDYYPPKMIQLGILRHRDAEEQRKILRTFRSRVQEKLMEGYHNQTPLTYSQAEECVWSELEELVLIS